MTEEHGTHIEQLKRALDAGLIDQDTYETAVAAMNAQLNVSGAIAQGQDALSIGAGGVGVGRDNYGGINTGVIIQQAARSGASREDLRRAYLARILTQADQLPLFVGDSAKAQIRLSSVYTALLTQRSEGDAAIGRLARDIGGSPKRTQKDCPRSTYSMPNASSCCSAGRAAARAPSSTSSRYAWPARCSA